MAELSSLGTLITIDVPKCKCRIINFKIIFIIKFCKSNLYVLAPGSVEIPTLLEQMIQATVSKIDELQAEDASKPIILIGFGAESLLACHVSYRYY